MVDTGEELNEKNMKIISYIRELKAQRDEISYLIKKQEEEMYKIKAEIEKNNYKLTLIARSLSQRKKAKEKYDMTIREAEEQYTQIVATTGLLLSIVSKDVNVLGEQVGRKVGTETTGETKKVAAPKPAIVPTDHAAGLRMTGLKYDDVVSSNVPAEVDNHQVPSSPPDSTKNLPFMQP